MQGKRFRRRIENFICAHCGYQVRGGGYTNHCPKCLWSKHVDINPGDRAATCGGMMRPVGVEGASPEYSIIHRCETCGYQARNRVSAGDDMHAILALAGSY